jgi:hypothetical protein
VYDTRFLCTGEISVDGVPRRLSEELATMHDVHALLERWKGIAAMCGDSEEFVKGGGGNHGRKVTPVGHLLAVLSQGPTTVAQIKGLHALAKSIEKGLKTR